MELLLYKNPLQAEGTMKEITIDDDKKTFSNNSVFQVRKTDSN